jgi:glycosyltransferase involved in cell wall biosynthesis
MIATTEGNMPVQGGLGSPSDPIRRVAFVGNYLPRQCGIATFTSDLATAFAGVYPGVHAMVVPMNDRAEGYEYPPEVRFEVEDRNLDSYRRAADFLNISAVDMVCLQHEFGIFGGDQGEFILTLLKNVRAPVVATLHTVLDEPLPAQRRVIHEMNRYCERFIVMTQKAVSLLTGEYKVPEGRIDVIPHGIPDVPFVDPSFYKDQFGADARKVLLTFGLLSPGKGIEHVIQALPRIIRKHPEALYMVVGATHPHVRMRDGESYRLGLRALAERLGVSNHLLFQDRFLTLEELIAFIGAADLYITPYLNRRQITSGTLAYAVGAGKAVISTPYWHAEELLADGRGHLIDFKAPEQIADAVNHLLDDEVARNTMRKKAYQHGRAMVWPVVVSRYMESFHTARLNRRCTPRRRLAERTPELPELNLSHLLALTDDTALFQHAIFTVPNYAEGYTLDDNARALVLAVLLEEESRPFDSYAASLQRRYLAFTRFCYDPAIQRFHNFVSFERRWLDQVGSEDSQGRTIWALGTMVGRSQQSSLRNLAAQLFSLAYPMAREFTYSRSIAFAIIGIQEYLRTLSGDTEMKRIRLDLSQRLFQSYEQNRSDDWPWFEGHLSYVNAKLPHALLMAGHWTNNAAYRDIALESLRWLMQQQVSGDGQFEPIGSERVWQRGQPKPRFDQQPIEAQACCSACLEAYRITSDRFWLTEATRCFQWFLGSNHLNQPLYDSQTGGCRDGLHADRCNENEGAESTLAFLLSLLEMRRFRQHSELVGESADERTSADIASHTAGAAPA